MLTRLRALLRSVPVVAAVTLAATGIFLVAGAYAQIAGPVWVLGGTANNNGLWFKNTNDTQIVMSNPAAARVYTIADAGGADTFTFNAATQTLTNKTVTAPVLSGTVTGTYTLGGTPAVGAAGTPIVGYWSGSLVITPSTVNQFSATLETVTVTGVTTGTTNQNGFCGYQSFNTATDAGIFTFGPPIVTATNQVNVRLLNPSVVTGTPPNGVIRCSIFSH